VPESTLQTRADLELRSPISPDLHVPDRALADTIKLADLTGVSLQHLRGAGGALRAATSDLPGDIGDVLPVGGGLAARPTDEKSDVRPVGGGLAARLTDDEWMLIMPEGADAPSQSEADFLVTVTDVSHGYGLLLVAGPRAPQILAKLCALDFSESAFPDLHAEQTSLGNVRALVLRRDNQDRRAYLIAVGRSVSEYVWELLLDAAGEFEPTVVDGASLIRNLVEGTSN
jgi:heterotetrameric sarcosine oxidase gamma subunit